MAPSGLVGTAQPEPRGHCWCASWVMVSKLLAGSQAFLLGTCISWSEQLGCFSPVTVTIYALYALFHLPTTLTILQMCFQNAYSSLATTVTNLLLVTIIPAWTDAISSYFHSCSSTIYSPTARLVFLHCNLIRSLPAWNHPEPFCSLRLQIKFLGFGPTRLWFGSSFILFPCLFSKRNSKNELDNTL